MSDLKGYQHPLIVESELHAKSLETMSSSQLLADEQHLIRLLDSAVSNEQDVDDLVQLVYESKLLRRLKAEVFRV